MEIHKPVFSSSQVATAAGMTATNFRAHLSRGNWKITGKAQPAEAFGKGHLFTIFDVLGYALANRLVARGIDPKVAFERAIFDFAHVGAAENNEPKQLMREPGGVFDLDTYGTTFFVYCPGAPRGRCIGAKSLTDVEALLETPTGELGDEAIVVNLNSLRDRVFIALGLDARDYE